VDTGGMTSGSKTIVSNTLFSGQSLRAKSQANAIPKGRINSVAAIPTEIEKIVICQVSKVKKSNFFNPTFAIKNDAAV
jgi:hypothetical protein